MLALFFIRRLIPILLCASGCAAYAQLTPAQRTADFAQLAANYAVRYGPAQWKRDALHVDILNIGDWLAKVAAAKDDLEFYEICVEYVASFDDAHDGFELPSNFTATLGFKTDIYDGHVLIDSIDRTVLPESTFPYKVGDEILSIDGISVNDLLTQFQKYAVAANTVSTNRVAASLLTSRTQVIMPHAGQLGDTANVEIKTQSGDTAIATIPWQKTGTPLTTVGPIVPVQSSVIASHGDYMAPLRTLRHMVIRSEKSVRGMGAVAPVFTLPDGFKIRLGKGRFDPFYSGTFQQGPHTIGYIRIPSFTDTFFEPDFADEIAYMQANTDGLIVDLMRNPGGDACYTEALLQHIMPHSFRTIGLEIRATQEWVGSFEQAVEEAQTEGAPDDILQQLQSILTTMQDAHSRPSGLTPPVPVCGVSLDVDPSSDNKGNFNAYTKPVMLLTDEFTASAAEMFAAAFQDNGRGPIFGARTMGAGGSVEDFEVTTYSEAYASTTESLMSRAHPVVSSEYPAAPYVENIGVRPDIEQEYMTGDNLQNNGRTFVQAFANAMVDTIEHSGAVAPVPHRKRR